MNELKTIRDILQALLDGHEVEELFEPNNIWKPVDSMCFYTQYLDDDEGLHNRYRIKITKPSINWDHVHPRFNYLARYKNGVVCLFEEGPTKIASTWRSSGGDVCRATTHSSLTVGNCEWYEGLVERPKDKE